MKFNYRKIRPTSPDRVQSKLVKYRKGDCFSIVIKDKIFLAAFIGEKFNKYYDFTFIEYFSSSKPTLSDFVEGRFWGRYRESDVGVNAGVHKNMMECKIVDNSEAIEKVGSLTLIETIEYSSYGYDSDVDSLVTYYFNHIEQRQINSRNFDKLPNQIFFGDRLIEVRRIMKE